MYPVPKHLRAILKPDDIDDDNRVSGTIVCPCSCNEFIVLHTGAIKEKGKARHPVVATIDGAFFFVVRAQCNSCNVEHMIFDDHYHGWNGYVCAPDEGTRELLRPQLVPWECSKCGCLAHRMSIVVTGEYKDDCLENGEGMLTEDDWYEAFGWLNIDIECLTCEHKDLSWVDYETM